MMKTTLINLAFCGVVALTNCFAGNNKQNYGIEVGSDSVNEYFDCVFNDALVDIETKETIDDNIKIAQTRKDDYATRDNLCNNARLIAEDDIEELRFKALNTDFGRRMFNRSKNNELIRRISDNKYIFDYRLKKYIRDILLRPLKVKQKRTTVYRFLIERIRLNNDRKIER